VIDIADPIRSTDASARTSLAALGLIGLATVSLTAIGLRIQDPYWNTFVLLLVLHGFLTIAATKVADRVPRAFGLALVAVIAIAMRLMVLGDDPILSSDIYRYIWDGRVQGAGINPYRYIPADPQLASLRDTLIYPNINRADYATTIYPPVAQFFFFAVTRLSESVTGMRLALIGCEIVILLALVDLLRRFNKSPALAVAYAWHPLAVWEIANSGHVDAVMVMLVMIGVWLLVRCRRIAAGILIALATLVKPYAIVILPACWKPWDWRLPVAATLVVIACYLPYIGIGQGVLGFLLGGYLSEEGFRGGEGFWLVNAARHVFGDIPGLQALYILFAAGVLGTLALRMEFTPEASPERRMRDIAMLLMSGLFFLSPNYAWYFLVVVPFIPIGGGAPAWALSIGALLLYLLYPDYTARFLIWKGVISIAFLLAVLAGTSWRTSWHAPMERALRWTR
jgi:alpha-1,6-mannosyltransferase